ncbi:MAG: NUDIX domain-containing protein [Candidatus Roizmanbacteria bacterium]
MNTNKNIHYYQKALLRALTTCPEGERFNRLIVEGLESEHMNYHLKQLIDMGYVMKENALYTLSDKGKDFTNRMDDLIETVEKQPKTSIIIWGVRKSGNANTLEHLVNRRLRHPYYGKVGRITGKVRFGETLVEAAQRELYEETGLTAKNFNLQKIYHKLRHRPSGEDVQDVIFYIFLVSDFTGSMITKTQHQENFWITKDDVKNKRYDFYDDFTVEENLTPQSHITFYEHSAVADGY